MTEPPSIASPRRELVWVDDAQQLWRSEATVLIVAGRDDDRDEMLAAASARVSGNLMRLFGRRLQGPESGAIVAVDVDDDHWHQVVWLSLGSGESQECRVAGAHAARTISADAALLTDVSEQAVGELLEGWLLGGYTYSRKTTPQPVAGSLTVAGDPQTYAAPLATAAGVWAARDLVNTPSNVKNPAWFADQVEHLLQGSRLRVSTMGAQALKRKGFGGICAVGAGSAHEPRLVTVRSPAAPGSPTVVLVGKGITFDTGGLSLKPPESMTTMKTDMSGAAAVVGALLAYDRTPGLQRDFEVIGLLPLAENMPSGSAYRPGDVVHHFGGLTSEISNTDAEGRLVLADALAYAVAQLQPQAIVDIATLTGAATLGLSRAYGALYSDSDTLARQLQAAGDRSGDPLWRMPLVPQYERFLDSSVADVAQSPTDSQARAGSITAALFLRRFVGDVPWAHLDIAGPARAEKPSGEVTVGGTGFGVRLLASWLREGADH